MARKMKETTWSNKQEWDGFHPTAYTLDGDRIWKLPIDRVTENPTGEDSPVTRTPTTVGDAFKPFNGWWREEGEQFVQVEGEPIVEIEGGGGEVTVKTSSGEERFLGSAFSARVLEVLLRLRKAGTNPFVASWFFFDSDRAYMDGTDSYKFFVVYHGKIVEEYANFSDSPDNGFDPKIFSTYDRADRFTFHEGDMREAWVSFWYRKFYTETGTGQLMVLRPDEPELYFYPEGRWKWQSTSAFARLEGRLQNISSLLIALVVIALLALIHWWR